MKKLKKYTELVTLKMEKSQLKDMEKACKKMNISVSELIRVAVQLSINKINK